jgi:CubicO group peptidase (beta-lactamase class C family)
MTFLGLTLIVLGCLGLFVGLLGLAAARLSEETVRRLGGESLRPYLRYAPLPAAAAAPLLLVGFVISDARRIADPLGALLLASTLVAITIALSLPAVSRLRGGPSTVWTTISGILAALLIAVVIAIGFAFSDLLSFLIFFGFAFLFLGALAAVGSVLWSLVALVRRRGRAAAGIRVWFTVSLAVIGLVAIGIMAPRSPSVPDSMTSAAELDRFLEDLVESDSPPGVSVVIVKDGETVYNKAFGVADGPNGIAATPDTVYHWYSDTKIVTAIAIMQLVEQDLIDLDDPVSDYLSFFEPEYPSASSEPVTVADLLNHSSGLQQNVPAVIGWLHLEDEPALDQTEFLRDKLPSYDKLKFEPGSEGVYTNVGYYTLAGVIAQVTGQSYEEYVVEHVLDPLGMVNTRFEYTDAMLANEGVGAHPMADIQTVFVPIMDLPYPFDYIREYDDGWIWFERFLFDGNAPSGLIGPAPEKARLVAAILNGGELEGARILSEESVDTMLNERHVEAGSSPESDEYDGYDEMKHGIGWFVVRDGDRLHHSHTGGGPGFAALMRLYPDEDLGIVILANGTNVEYDDIADAIADIEW